MNIGYFGGSFDPVHLGHLAAARAAFARLKLHRILFVPTESPPHKRTRTLAPFAHRYAMLALALAGEPRLVPSLLEAPPLPSARRYSIDTMRRLRRQLPADRIFFLIGIDAFLEVATWRRPEALLRTCEFVVISRPGYSLAQAADALPAAMRPRTIIHRAGGLGALRTLRLPGVTMHLLEGVNVPISATHLRAAIAAGNPRGWRKQVPPAVAGYIRKMHLYQRE